MKKAWKWTHTHCTWVSENEEFLNNRLYDAQNFIFFLLETILENGNLLKKQSWADDIDQAAT